MTRQAQRYLCAYLPCGREFVRVPNKEGKPQPKYCSMPCRNRDVAEHVIRRNDFRKKYDFTPEMDALIVEATARGRGGLKALTTLQSFRMIPYTTLKRRAQAIGASRSFEHTHWGQEESDICEDLYHKGACLETIQKTLKTHGYHRTASGIQEHLRKMRIRKNGEFYSATALMEALGVQHRIMRRWIDQQKLTPHHIDTMGEWFDDKGIRRFLLKHPHDAARGRPDVVWLIGMLSTPGIRKERSDE